MTTSKEESSSVKCSDLSVTIPNTNLCIIIKLDMILFASHGKLLGNTTLAVLVDFYLIWKMFLILSLSSSLSSLFVEEFQMSKTKIQITKNILNSQLILSFIHEVLIAENPERNEEVCSLLNEF